MEREREEGRGGEGRGGEGRGGETEGGGGGGGGGGDHNVLASIHDEINVMLYWPPHTLSRLFLFHVRANLLES